MATINQILIVYLKTGDKVRDISLLNSNVFIVYTFFFFFWKFQVEILLSSNGMNEISIW